MSVNDHHRKKIVSQFQHLYEHDLSEFSYTHSALPNTVLNAEQALDYAFNVIYPQNKSPVATPADLPTGINVPNVGDVAPSINDQRVVQDDGDGKAAMYIFQAQDGVPASWIKIADIDWGINNVITALQDQTQYLYFRKYGATDYDPTTGLALLGLDSGQHIFGGDLANQNLSLHANNGDIGAAHTGYVQVDDDFRPMADLAYDIGTAVDRFNTGYFGTLVVGTATMTLTSNLTSGLITDTSGVIGFDNNNLITTGNVDASIITGSASIRAGGVGSYIDISPGLITDISGSISFGNENLSTTGTLSSGVITADGTLVISSGSITDSSGTLSFGSNSLSTTGTLGAGATILDSLTVDNLVIDNNRVSINLLNADLELIANGAGKVKILSTLDTLDQSVAGAVNIVGLLNVDAITIDSDIISSSTNIINLFNNLAPTIDDTLDIGVTTKRFRHLFMSGNIQDDANVFSVSNLMKLRSSNFRDVAMSQPAQVGDALFYDGSRWLASVPDTEIDHGSLNGILDDDHTQYAMLAGRGVTQTINGGVLSGSLSLRNNSTLPVGLDLTTSIDPSGDASLDLGRVSKRFKNLNMSGQLIGARVQNTLDANVGTFFSAAEEGRLLWSTDKNKLYVNDSSSFVRVGRSTYSQIKTNLELLLPIDVSADIGDAINAIWQLSDTVNNEVMAVAIHKTATTVTISNDVALPNGNYKLMGIEL